MAPRALTEKVHYFLLKKGREDSGGNHIQRNVYGVEGSGPKGLDRQFPSHYNSKSKIIVHQMGMMESSRK